MSAKKHLCPKCQGLLTIKISCPEGGCEIHQVSCVHCQFVGEPELTENFALACFYREHGEQLLDLDQIAQIGGPPACILRRRIKRYPDAMMKKRRWFLPRATADVIIAEEKRHTILVSLAKIQEAGGPTARVMRWRILSGYYPDVQMKKRGWKLPRETADRVTEEWKRSRYDMVPLADVAVQCGLGRTSLNPQATRGIIHATLLYNRWYVTKSEVERLRQYYSDTVTSSEAAEILGFSHRSYVLKLSKEKLPYECLGVMRRFRRTALQDFLNARSVPKVKQ
jgi:hypothetical protein